MERSTCLFCSIYASKSNILYENESCFVLLDINPLSHSHLLVIPKKHGECLHDYNQEDLLDVLPTIQKIVNRLGLRKYNVLQNNEHLQSIKHVHFHIIPALDAVNCLKIDWSPVDVEKNYVQTQITRLIEKLKD